MGSQRCSYHQLCYGIIPSNVLSYVIFLAFPLHLSFAALILPNTALTPSSSSRWTSPNGTFSMGFFSFLPNTFYVGIWYSSLPINQSIIWTANRDQAVTANGSLQFMSDGQLQFLTTAPNASVLSVRSLFPDAIASQGELLESGNFVLRDNAMKVIWQSFDHPTDTVLPGQNFSFSSNPTLVPWTNASDPSSSTSYSLVFGRTAGPTGHIRLLYRNVAEYWSEPPPYITTTLFNTTFSMDMAGTLTLTNGDGRPIWINVSCASASPNSFIKLQLSVDGNLRVLSWSQESDAWLTQWRALYFQCDVFGCCGGNSICDRNQNNLTVGGGGCPLPEVTTEDVCFCPQGFQKASSGCVPPYSPHDCSQYMVTLDHTAFGVPGQNADYGNLTQQACVNTCLDDCNCTAATYRASSSECWTQHGSLFNGVRYYQTPQSSFIKTVAPMSSISVVQQPSRKTLPVYAVVIIVIGVMVIFFAGFFGMRQQRSGHKRFKEVVLPETFDRFGGPHRFAFKDLQMVTGGFSEENKLGSGGFGSVYMGTFSTARGKLNVAIKRLSIKQGSAMQDDDEAEDAIFLAEIETLASIRHVNIVNLMGFCADGRERLLVYEYVANGSLNHHLFTEKSIIPWDTRFHIAIGVATGIEYLHTHCPMKVVHRDIKPDNILIDTEFRSKVADFGVAQIMRPERTHLTNNALCGTPTYMAPECWQVGALVTEKADAYSFGVVLLEIVSGKMVTKDGGGHGTEGGGEEEGSSHSRRRRRRLLFLQDALDVMEARRWESLVDERLGSVYNREDAERLLKIVFWCLQGNPEQRPCMEDLVLMLKGHKMVSQPPLLGIFDFPFRPCSAGHNSSLQSNILPEHLTQGR